MEKVRPWWGRPSDRGRLKKRTAVGDGRVRRATSCTQRWMLYVINWPSTETNWFNQQWSSLLSAHLCQAKMTVCCDNGEIFDVQILG